MKRWFSCLLLAGLLLAAGCGQEPTVSETAESAPPAEAAAGFDVLPAPDPNAAPSLIAHAGGAIYGYRLTNSREALDRAYDEGFRFIELDFSRTADGELVLIHDWESVAKRMLGEEGCLTEAEFLSRPAFAGLTLLDLDGVLDWLALRPDCFVITDIKAEENTAALAEIRERAGELADRFIPQIYSYEEYPSVAALGYPRVILTLYRLPLELDRVEAFVREYRPWGLTVAQERLSDQLLEAVRRAGPDTAVFAHTVNDLSVYETWQPKGLTGIYTDYFVPDHWFSSP